MLPFFQVEKCLILLERQAIYIQYLKWFDGVGTLRLEWNIDYMFQIVLLILR